ncbi:MAG: colanic acid/amylovoran biosynthesis glycosyltransferase, partial [Humisphaera sp.]|nr:colanic acid/amylovoran biosynthesis glycosyltransferase [Humisphaera sp.]
ASQTFIRREILALEKLGLTVERFTIRRANVSLVDERDKAEQQKARAVLDVGGAGLLGAVLKTLFTRPIDFLRGFSAAIRTGARSHAGAIKHQVYLAEACVLLGWFRARKIDHVHAHFGTNSTMVAMLVRIMGGPPYSFTSHGPEEYDKPEAISLPEKVRRSKFVVAISEFGASQLYRWCRYADWPKVKIVRCGVDEMFLKAAANTNGQLPPPPAEGRIVNIGRLESSKGQLFLIEAAGRLAAEGMKFQLTIVGDGTMRPELERLIEKLKLKDHVRLAGWMSNEQVRQEILNSRAMVLPSFAEGLPLVIMEALALHRPVLSTYVAGIPELVTPGVCGWLVPPGSTDGLTAAMREVLTSPVERLAEMGGVGAARVAERHDAAKEAEKLAAMFRAGAGAGGEGGAA